MAFQPPSEITLTESERQIKLSSKLFGKPVEEVDPFVFEDTFCVVAKKYKKHYIYRFSASKSLYIFGPLNPFRRFSCCVMTNQLFDLFIMLVIICNCVTLCFITNYEVGVSGVMYKDSARDDIFDIIEDVYLGIYTSEMILKVIAKGFVVNKFSYLRNAWNMLDFLVVTFAWLSVIVSHIKEGGESVDISFFRTFRVLRALKTISILPGLKMIINALIKSIRQLLEVMFLTFFVLMIFSLLALELFQGKLLQKCILVKNGAKHLEMIADGDRDGSEATPINPKDPYVNKLWYEWVNDESNWLVRNDSYPKEEYVPCANTTELTKLNGRQCPRGFICLPDIGDNFDDDQTNFDTFWSSMLSTFQLITTDFWERLYELILSTTTPFSVIFFIIVIFLGSFYLLNLMLAVVAMSYEDEVQSTTEDSTRTKHQKLSQHRTASTFSFEDPRRLRVQVMTHFKRRTPSEREMIARNLRLNSYDAAAHEEEDDGDRKRPNLHTQIMIMLGRKVESTKLPTKTVVKKKPVVPTEPPSTKSSKENLAMAQKPTEIKPSTTEIKVLSKEPSKNDVTTPATTAEADKSTKQEENVDGKSIAKKSRKSKRSTAKKQATCCQTNIVKRTLTPFVLHWGFETTITVVIIINTILMASEHHDQPLWLDKTIAQGNVVFTCIFTAEALIKILALQKDYFTSFWNVFDFTIVVMSYIEIFLEQFVPKVNGVRALRLLRVFKLAQSWITMKVLLSIIFSTFGALGNLILVLLIVLYIFAVLGLQVIGSYYTKEAFGATQDENEFPRWNFQDFFYGFMMVFRVICGEWIEPLWDCLAACKAKGDGKDQYKCYLIFLPILIVGNFIVLNLFLALLLNSFDTDELNKQKEKEMEAAGKTTNVKKFVSYLLNKKKSATKSIDGEAPTLVPSITGGAQPGGDAFGKKPGAAKARFKKIAKKIIAMRRNEIAAQMIEKVNLKRRQINASIRLQTHVKANAQRHSSFGFPRTDSTTVTEDLEKKNPDPCVPKKVWNLNCCCSNCLRRRNWTCWDSARGVAVRIVTHPFFEWLILALICSSSVTLIFDNKYASLEAKRILFYCNTVFTAIFCLEMLLKWFALGMYTYFTSAWTILDFIIVTISLMTLQTDIQDIIVKQKVEKNKLAGLKAFRTLRALRPLRVISRWQGMKIVINALMYAIPSIVNVLFVCLLFWLVFSILGVQFFKGKFYRVHKTQNHFIIHDNDEGETLPYEFVKSKQECCNHTDEWSWVNVQPNFDNVFMGYLTLFQVATFEGWMEAMSASIDSTDVDMQPRRDHNRLYYLFYVVFIVFGTFFTLNLFIGVIIDNFNRLKKKYEGNSVLEALLTEQQLKYYTAMKKLSRKKPRKVIRRPDNQFLSLFYDLSMSRRFEIAVFIVIFLNMLIMAFEVHNQPKIWDDILSALNSFFTFLYFLECIVKIIGLRQYYFTVGWNVFDFALVIASILDLATGDTFDISVIIAPQMLRIIRVFRIGRVLRLVKAAKGIRKLLFALIVSLPALFNIGALLSLITFIYAILGVTLFGNIAQHSAIDEMFNFETFGRSCLMLLRLMTAAGWNDVLFAMTPEYPVCGSYRKIKCGGPDEGECANVPLAIAYLVSYLIISFLIVINMYIAIILENFVEASKEEEIGIVEDDIEMFYVRWSRYDPQATQFINFDQLSEFLASLDPPLGLPRPNIVAIVAFNLPIARGNKIHCLDILQALVKHKVGTVDDSEEFQKLQAQMEQKFRKQFPTRKLLELISTTRIWKIQHNAAVIIQRAWRAYRTKKHPVERSKSIPSLSHRRTSLNREDHHGMLNNLLHLRREGRERKKRRQSQKSQNNDSQSKSGSHEKDKKKT